MGHHLMGLAEIAELLGVSRQRVGQLIEVYADFPAPEIELSAGRVWARDAIAAWIASHPDRSTGRPSFAKASPFEAVEWTGSDCRVRVGARWYGLLSIQEVALSDIVIFARAKYKERWRKRIDEDLVEVLDRMGHPAEDSVTLRLREAGSGRERVVQTEMTYENRQAIWLARNAEAIEAIAALKPRTGSRDGAPEARSLLETALANARAVLAGLEVALKRIDQ